MSNTVDIWQVGVDESSFPVEYLQSILSPDEVIRAERFINRESQQKFIISHGSLRIILSKYIGASPEDIEFGYTYQGKPFLIQSPNNEPLYFNLSHTGKLALVAVTRIGKVGVDVETIHPISEMDILITEYLSPYECDVISRLTEPLKTTAFFNVWVLKEAYLKANGLGLYQPINRFSIFCAPGDLVAQLETPDDPQEALRWRLLRLVMLKEYAAALVVQDSTYPDLVYRDFIRESVN